MDAQIIPFRYEDSHEVRTVNLAGEPWFVAADIASTLGYSATAALTRTLDEDEKGVHNLHTPGGDQSVTIISEAGLYSAILRSRVAGARQFKRWITHEVIPAVRKTGGYGLARQLPQTHAEALRALADEVEAHEATRAVVRELTPAANAWHAIADAKGDFSVGDAAKMLSRDPGISTGEQRLHRWMAAHGWTFRRPDGRPRAYQSKVDAGLLVEKIGSPYLNHKLGEYVAPAPTIRITPKGMDRLYRELGGMDAMVEVAS